MVDTVLRVVTPEGISFELHPAGPLPRLAALLIDVLLQFVAFIGIVLVMNSAGVTGNWITLLVSFGMMWFYMVAFELLDAGRTPGKHVLGLQVVQRDGTPPRPGSSLLRNLLRFVDYFCALGLLVPLFGTGFRRIGDVVAGTLVIYVPDELRAFVRRSHFEHAEPTPPQRILDGEASLAVMEFARRRSALGPGLRRELSELALPVYLLDPENVGDAESALVSIAAWYAGVRK